MAARKLPGLRGRRVVLSPLAAGDAEALFAAVEASREALRRRLRWTGAVRSPKDCLAFIKTAGAAGRVYGLFEPRRRELVGVAALQGPRLDEGLAELSGWVRADRRDRGCASEAARLLVESGFRKEGLHRIVARIDPVNRAARKVLQRLGFRYEGCLRREKRLNGRWIDQECWGMLKSEWKRK